MSDGEKFFKNAIFVTLALVVVTAIIWNYAQTNPLFAWAMLGSGGVFLAIVAKAKGIFDGFSLSDITDIFYR